MVFNRIHTAGHEQVIFCQDASLGLRAIIAIHDTGLGPALGGCRMHAYKSEQDALQDVLKLSQAMSLKAAISEIPLGGGKSVIIGDPDKHKSPEVLARFGEYVASLQGRYIVSKDSGISLEDLQKISKKCPYVIGRPEKSGGVGDPSPHTALGVYLGIKSAVKYKYGKESLKGRRIVVQGAGSVGLSLLDHLFKAGMEVYVSDVRDAALDKVRSRFPQAKLISPDEVFTTPCDILSPCALGGVINKTNIDSLSCSILLGAANNILEDISLDKLLLKKGVLYAPDFLVNSGGLIYVYANLLGKEPQKWALKKINNIEKLMIEVLNTSKEQGKTPLECAMAQAEMRMKQGRSGIYVGDKK